MANQELRKYLGICRNYGEAVINDHAALAIHPLKQCPLNTWVNGVFNHDRMAVRLE